MIYECDFKSDAARVAKACQEFAYVQAVCSNLDYNRDESYRMEISELNLSKVHQIYHSPSYVIVGCKSEFMIVSDSDYYWAIAGLRSFVSRVAINSISEDLKSFRLGIQPYVQSEDAHNRSIGSTMMSYYEVCKTRL